MSDGKWMLPRLPLLLAAGVLRELAQSSVETKPKMINIIFIVCKLFRMNARDKSKCQLNDRRVMVMGMNPSLRMDGTLREIMVGHKANGMKKSVRLY